MTYLDALGIPWAIVADGPALRANSSLEKQLAAAGRLPSAADDRDGGLSQRRDWWEAAGLFTLAHQYGDTGGKQGEIEAFLARIDANLLSEAHAEMGNRNKPLVAAYGHDIYAARRMSAVVASRVR